MVTGSAPERAGSGYGLLKVQLRKATRAHKPTRQLGTRQVYRYPLPGVPLLLIDSQPVVQGIGTAWVRVPPGEHRCSVQAGGFAGWWTVEVAEGTTVDLDAHPDRAWTSIDHEPPLQPERFARKIRYWTTLFYAPIAFTVAFVLGFLPASLIRNLAPEAVDEPSERAIGYGVFVAFVLGLWSVMAVHHIVTMNRSKRHLRFQQRLAATPRLTGGPPVHELPMTAAKLPETATDGGILLDLTWEVVWQRIDKVASIDWWLLEQYGEPEIAAHRPWIADPTVVLGDHDLDLSWGRWWIPLPPGSHELELAVPRQGEGEAPAVDDRYLTWHDTVEVQPGRISHVRLNGRAVQRYEQGRHSLRLTGFEHEARTYGGDGNLIGFRRSRLPRKPLDGQTDERLHHSIMENRDRHDQLTLRP
ncbi:hypothetical protein K3N28_12680 [Glycomyces sp. TRM65418]|uniref:hypothetical protein n=1 Tax=Glycomyces sp. TRM65418 TaxID=2867006 RepID=UPI001CE51404|nr:hypothetical protein [Glycomyces sp. TRM65418]MCC3763920.1 hypothetical protein [Glycomyces sp. TRM65418]QZD53622.1 hypothetical protein K3N28_12610 [Glycomyces sp. TRM65418]